MSPTTNSVVLRGVSQASSEHNVNVDWAVLTHYSPAASAQTYSACTLGLISLDFRVAKSLLKIAENIKAKKARGFMPLSFGNNKVTDMA